MESRQGVHKIRHLCSGRDRHNGILQQDMDGAGRGARIQRRYPLSALAKSSLASPSWPCLVNSEAGPAWKGRWVSVTTCHGRKGPPPMGGTAKWGGSSSPWGPSLHTSLDRDCPTLPSWQPPQAAAEQDVENIKGRKQNKTKRNLPPSHLPPVTPKTALGNAQHWALAGWKHPSSKKDPSRLLISLCSRRPRTCPCWGSRSCGPRARRGRSWPGG